METPPYILFLRVCSSLLMRIPYISINSSSKEEQFVKWFFFVIFAHSKVLQHSQDNNASSSEGATSDSCEGPILVDKNPTPSVGACNLEQLSTSDSREGPTLVDIYPAPTKGACNYEQPPTSNSCEGPSR